MCADADLDLREDRRAAGLVPDRERRAGEPDVDGGLLVRRAARGGAGGPEHLRPAHRPAPLAALGAARAPRLPAPDGARDGPAAPRGVGHRPGRAGDGGEPRPARDPRAVRRDRPRLRLAAAGGGGPQLLRSTTRDDSRMVLTDAPERAETKHAGVPFTSQPNPVAKGAPYASNVEVAHETRTGIVTLADFDFRRPRFPVVYRSEQKGAGRGPARALCLRARHRPRRRGPRVGQGHRHPRRRRPEPRAHRRAPGLRARRAPPRRPPGGPAPRPALHQPARPLAGRRPHARRLAAPRARGGPAPAGPPDQHRRQERQHLEREGRRRLRLLRGAPAAARGLAADRGPAERRRRRPRGARRSTPTNSAACACSSTGIARASTTITPSPGCASREGWAGAGFGMVALPRVGQEVLVAFSEGNPDQPVIVGRLYGGSNPVPNGLPAGRAQTVWRSRSSPASSGFHELSFDDTAGREKRASCARSAISRRSSCAAETEETDGDRTSVVGHEPRRHGRRPGQRSPPGRCTRCGWRRSPPPGWTTWPRRTSHDARHAARDHRRAHHAHDGRRRRSCSTAPTSSSPRSTR